MLKKLILSGILATTSLGISQNAHSMQKDKEIDSLAISLPGREIQKLLTVTDYEVQIEGVPYKATYATGKHDSILMGNGFKVYSYEFLPEHTYQGKKQENGSYTFAVIECGFISKGWQGGLIRIEFVPKPPICVVTLSPVTNQ